MLRYVAGNELYTRSSCQLEKLTIFNDSLPGYFGDIDSYKLPMAESRLSGLKEFVLDHCWCKDEFSSWDWFWRSCGNVERL